MKFTIIIPFYEKYDCFFDDCINSVLCQSFKEFECVIVASSSEMKALTAHKQILDNKITIIESVDVDQSSKRNVGINGSKGDYLIFLDCDDILDKNFLNLSEKEIKTHDPDLIVFGFTRDLNKIGETINLPKFIGNQEECRNNIFSDYMLEKHLPLNVNYDSSCWKVFKKSLIQEKRISFQVGLKCAEDSLFVRTYSLYVNSMAVNDSYFSYYWRINPKSTMNDINSGFFDLEPFFVSLKKILDELPKKYSTNFDWYINMIIRSRLESALRLSKKGDYKIIDLIKKYRKSNYIKNAIKPSLYKDRFYKTVALTIKHRVFGFFQQLLKVFVYFR